MYILIAPNAFKNSLTAPQAAAAIQKGIVDSRLPCKTECFPVGDGGDGTAQLIIDKFKGYRVKVDVRDPLNRTLASSFGLIDNGKTAVIEMADASGVRLLKENELNPMYTSSVGTGELIRAALDQGVSKIIIGLGGSATIDGGAGLLNALGVKFLDQRKKLLEPTPEKLLNLSSIDISGMDPRVAQCKFHVLCDVDNQLLGSRGCVAVFGPQKGAQNSDMPKFDKLLAQFASLAFNVTGKHMDKMKHGGAAGGVAGALYAFCDAELVAGAEHFLRITNFEDSLKKCDLVITGEGSLDAQTLEGKAPLAVSVLAKSHKIKVIGVAGRVPLHRNSELDRHFDMLLPIGHQPSDLPQAISDTEPNLIRTGTLIGNFFS